MNATHNLHQWRAYTILAIWLIMITVTFYTVGGCEDNRPPEDPDWWKHG